jgi:integrase
MSKDTTARRRSPSAFGKVMKMRSGRFQASYVSRGNQRQYAPTTFKTRTEAGDWLALQRGSIVTGTWHDPQLGRMTFADFAKQYWASEVTLGPSTRKRDEFYCESYMVPTFGPHALARIDRPMIQRWVAELSRTGGRAGQGLAPRSVQKAGQVLHKLMAEAKRQGRLVENPASGIKYPKATKGRRMVITPEEVEQLAEAINPRYRALVPFLCWTALRVGEAFALEVADVTLDGEDPSVSVTKRVVDLGELHFGETKTEAGERTVPLTDDVVAELRRHIAALGLSPHDPLFPAPRGGTTRTNTWRPRVWNPAIEKCGFAGFNPHQARRTAATRWQEFGVPLPTARVWMGHADIDMLVEVYTEPEKTVERRLIAKVNAAIRESTSGGADVVPIRR